jgi:hypothetical protein
MRCYVSRGGNPLSRHQGRVTGTKLGSVANLNFGGKIRKPSIGNSMTCRLQNSRKSKFATEPVVDRFHGQSPRFRQMRQYCSVKARSCQFAGGRHTAISPTASQDTLNARCERGSLAELRASVAPLHRGRNRQTMG